MDAPQRLWGPQTELAVGNFPIARRPLDVRVAKALARIKRHAAAVNAAQDVPGVTAEVAAAIADAARRVEAGELDEHFPIDVFQTGSGTSTNMNVNEVLSTLASATVADGVHPNDHVNASQSSNDTVPTAIRIAMSLLLVEEVHPAVEELIAAFRDMSTRFAHVVKAGRTHLMDATPVTLGQEADAWAGLLAGALARSRADIEALGELPLGGTAVGTGINASTSFAPAVIAALAAETGLPLRASANPMVQQGGQGALADASAGLRAIAVALTKIANDIRLLASGPAAGLGELLLPELQAGSSIMPGKVNPVLCEAVNQVAARVFGNDHTVAYGASQGILELNTYLPVIADALFESGTLLANVCRLFAERCVAGIEADEERCRSYAEKSSALATALNPIIGYARAAELVHRSLDERRSIIDLVIEDGILEEEEARRVLDPIHLTHPS
jgi:fumarate hydratase, class II